ncbi:MAG: LPXTG cell wall anchor domain-containing protein, partial [Eubacteriaceae bacterium]|nr:LPXTG cell wall anchor domain-containing protein [Eubacteriaceae bacterium]
GDDPSSIEHFTGASVDGADLTEGTDFTVKAGSVVLDLLPEYLDSLSAGNHTLKVQFDGRFDVDVDINIVVPADPNPKTGVGSNMGLYAGILIIAALAAFGLIAYRRKQNRMK